MIASECVCLCVTERAKEREREEQVNASHNNCFELQNWRGLAGVITDLVLWMTRFGVEG